jgi:putative two-component system response regulator
MVGSPSRVLIVDDEPRICELIQDVLARAGFECTQVNTGRNARRQLLEESYDAVVLDVLLPDVPASDVLNFITSHGLTTGAVCISGVPRENLAEQMLEAGAASFVAKPFEAADLVAAVRSAVAHKPSSSSQASASTAGRHSRAGKRESHRIRQMLLESAGALVRAVEAKDPYTRRHSEHVARYAESLARHVGLPPQLVEVIQMAALLHDIGKIAVPDSILTKPGKLTSQEYTLICQHPEVGAAILENISLLSAEAVLVRHHHERWDGQGYPAGLAGEEIPVGARVLNIADSIDAMLMQRTYKGAYSVQRMLDELARGAGSQFEPQLAAQAIAWCRANPAELILPDSLLADSA